MANREPDKNPGKLLTSEFTGGAGPLQRFLTLFGKQRTTQAVPLGTPNEDLSGPDVESNTTRTRTDELDKETIAFADGQSTHAVTDYKLTREFGGGIVDVTETQTSTQPSVDSGYAILDSTVTKVGPSKWVKHTEQCEGFPILYDYYTNPLQNGQLISVQYAVVNSSQTLPADSAGVHFEVRHIDKWRSMLITKTASQPTSFNEFRFGAWTMPGLFDITSYIFTDECGAFANFRPEQSMMTRMYTQYDWFTTKPTRQACFTARTVSEQIGKGWQGWQRVLIDDYPLPITCGGVSYTWDITASDPSYMDYLSTIQSDPTSTSPIMQLVAEEVVLDEFNFWKRTSLYAEYL